MKAWPLLHCTGTPCGLFDHVHGVPDQARVVHDLAAGVARQDCLGQQADQVVALDEAAGVVEEEAAVEVAVPGNAEIGTVFAHGVGGGGAVLRQQRVGNAVGETAVRLVADADELERQVWCQQIDDGTGTAAVYVDHQLQRSQLAWLST